MRKMLFAILAVLSFSTLEAQPLGDDNIYDFTPGERVVFTDKFDSFDIDNFPFNWYHIKSEAKGAVKKMGTGWEFQYLGGHGDIARSKIPVDSLEGELITFECDVIFRDSNSSFRLFFSSGVYKFDRYITLDKDWIYTGWVGDLSEKRSLMRPIHYGYFPEKFEPLLWHHFAVSYTKKEVRTYLDNYRISRSGIEGWSPDDGKGNTNSYTPKSFTIGGHRSYSVKNVRVSVSHHAPDPSHLQRPNELEQLLAHDTFVTHSILFDVNRSEIKPESSEFIVKLAQFLSTNPRIKIRVNGHTDNAGDTTANRVLSLNRANEVKRQLVLRGIDPGRMVTKGYGSSVPIANNRTTEGKAKNRRVEFIKLH